MPLTKGRVALTRYKVAGELPTAFWDYADRKVRCNIFRDIENGTEELSTGWVSADDFMDTEFAFASFRLEPYLVLGFRVDQRKLTSSQVNKYHRLEIIKAKRMREGGKLSRAERMELRDKARISLLAQTRPATNLYQMCWNTVNGELWLDSATPKVRDLFEDHFKRTFELLLEPRIPFLLARDLLGPGRERKHLEEARALGLDLEAGQEEE